MFNVIKTRAAVSILEWLTSFFAHSSGGLLGGRPAAGVEFHMLSLKQSNGNFSRVRGSLWREPGRHLQILSFVFSSFLLPTESGADGVNTRSLEMWRSSCFY